MAKSHSQNVQNIKIVKNVYKNIKKYVRTDRQTDMARSTRLLILNKKICTL